MNRLFKYFSIFGILLVFSAYFFRLFEVNGYVKAINALPDPSNYFLALGKIYKIDYFFIALIMVSCLVSFILMNKEKKMPLFSVSLIPIGMSIIERLYFVISSNAVAKATEGSNISIVSIVNIVILALGLLSVVNSILVTRFLDNKPLPVAFSLFSVASITASTLISIYAAIIGKASVHFIIFSVFFLLALVLFIMEFILKFKYKPEPVEESPQETIK